MFRLARPPSDDIEALLDAQRALPFTYPEVGATHPRREQIPANYTKDYTRFLFGHGAHAFAQAKRLLRSWQMYAQPWLELHPSPPGTAEGSVGCVVAQHLGVYSVSSFRVVYSLEDPRQSAFAIGTLPGHVERGEERFRTEQLDDESVWVDVLAFSRPQHPLVRLGYPFARYMQRRFAQGAVQAFKTSNFPQPEE